MDDIKGLVKQAVSEVDTVLADPKNKNTILASAIAYILSKNHKERNAIVTGILTYTLLGRSKEAE